MLEGRPYRRLTGLHLESGEQATFTAAETTEVLLMGLPDVARINTVHDDAGALPEEELAEA